MTNPKALAATERTALTTALFENPELMAMTAICEILQELPDEAARMRVMHWAFGRFSTEFKRPASAPAAAAAQAFTAPAPAPPRVALEPQAPVVPASIAARVTTPTSPEEMDFGRQVSELGDLFAPPQRGALADSF
jgi:hypothetical protein